ncbi:MAG: acetyltransferase [Lachnospiraceae bacterium]|nr:acetyltransferase [Lachnospiraceae bacterium]
MKKIIMIGCGGHAKSMLDAIESEGEYEVVGFIGKDMPAEFSYRGYKIIGTDADMKRFYMDGIRHACIGIGYLGKGDARKKLYDSLKKIGFLLPPVIDATAVVARDVLIGEGSFVGKNAVINSAAVVGKMAIVNTGAIVEHDCVVGDFSHVAVSAVLCGGVEVGKGCFIGANAVARQGIKTGDFSIVGAGAVVVGDIPANVTVVGIPAAIV